MIEPAKIAAAVLAKASSVDPRMPTASPATVLAWAELLAGIHLDEALAAVADHYHASRDPIMPADVVSLVRAARQDRANRAAIAELPPPRPMLPSPVPRSVLALSPAHRSATSVPCPWCHANVGEPCTRPAHGGRRPRKEPHPSRVEAARSAA